MKVNAILLKPLDGYEPGSPRQFDKADFDRLRAMNAVREAGAADAVEQVPDTEDALMLERLRHPVDGPKLLADMKARFEVQHAAIASLTNDLDASRASVGAVEAARDEALRDRDAIAAERDAASAAASVANEELAALRAERDANQNEGGGGNKTKPAKA